MEEAARKFRLYALPFSVDGVEVATKERFSRISTGYVLIYTDGEAPQNSAEITEAEVSRLTVQDERWLFDCNVAILAEETKSREADILADLNERLDRLEKVFAEEAAKREG